MTYLRPNPAIVAAEIVPIVLNVLNVKIALLVGTVETAEEEIVETILSVEALVVVVTTILKEEAEEVTVEVSSAETHMVGNNNNTINLVKIVAGEKNPEVDVETSKTKEVTVAKEVATVVVMINQKDQTINTRKMTLKKLIKNKNNLRTYKRQKKPLIMIRTVQSEQVLYSFNKLPALR